MTKTLAPLCMAAVLALPGPAAMAQDAIFWKSVGQWEVSIDPTIGNGCYALASWTGGTVVRIGLNPQADNFYLLIGNDAWSSLEAEKGYELTIRFDRRAPWDVAARGLQFNPGETVYLHAQSTKFDFIEEFMRSNRMKISYDGKEIDTLKLTGSSRAMKEVMACQEEADKRGAGATDPFASGGSAARSNPTGRKADPFAN